MSKLSDYIKSGGALIDGNAIISNATGIVDIDLTSSQAYTIEQGAGDLTINVISAPDAKAEGLLSVKRNFDYALSYTGAGVTDKDGLLDKLFVYTGDSFRVNAQDTAPYGIIFNNDGTKMFMVGYENDSVFQYSLTTGFDLSTASYDNVSFSVAGQDTSPLDIAFNSDGTKMFMVGNTNDSVYQYSLTTGFDLSTASYDSVSFSVAAQDTYPRDVAFNTDGTKMFMLGVANNSVYQYSLTTGFDLSTASYDNVSFSIASQDTAPFGIAFNNDGTKMFMVGNTNDSVFQYSLTTGFDLSTASYDAVSFSVASQDTTPVGIAFNTDGTKMLVLGNINKSVYEYKTPQTIQTTHTYGSYPQIVSEANI